MNRKIRGLQIVLVVFGLFAVVWFLIPFFLHRILNIGNITGIIIFVCLFVYGIKMQNVNNWISKKSKSKIEKMLLGFFGLAITIISILVFIFSYNMILAANKGPSGNPTVIVLGCRVYGDRASLMLMERLDAAYEYLSENSDAVCILSGGQGAGEDITEAECMYQYLVEKGIQPKRLYKEENSTSTRENLAFSSEIIEENNLNRDIAIVTNEFHEYRAGKVAKTLNLNFTAISGKTAWWLFPTYYVRELYGIMYEIIC